MGISARRSYAAQLWVLAAAGLMLIAGLELYRVANRRLFLFATTFDNQPSVHELKDATTSARRWLLPALLSIGCACAIGDFLNTQETDQQSDSRHKTSRIFRVSYF